MAKAGRTPTGIDQGKYFDAQFVETGDEDPQEMNNLAENPGYRERFTRLQDQLERLQKEVGDDPEDIGYRPRGGNLGLDVTLAKMEEKLTRN